MGQHEAISRSAVFLSLGIANNISRVVGDEYSYVAELDEEGSPKM